MSFTGVTLCSGLCSRGDVRDGYGQGLGRLLMSAIRAEGARQDLEWLLLRTSESRRGYYEKCGFQECLRSSVIRLQG